MSLMSSCWGFNWCQPPAYGIIAVQVGDGNVDEQVGKEMDHCQPDGEAGTNKADKVPIEGRPGTANELKHFQ